MAITYGATPGTIITSHAMTETLPDQTQQTGNNTVIVSDLLSVIGGGNIGTGANGIGDSYAGRLLIIDLGLSTEQRRYCISDAAGTGTTRILTVHEDWDVNPVITTDTIHVPYEAADIEDGGSGGGIGLGSKTGLWEVSNLLTIAITGGLQLLNGAALEMDDQGTGIAFFVESGGYLYSGFEAGGGYINGGIFTSYNNATTEPNVQFQSGSKGYIYDALWWGQLHAQKWEHANGAGIKFYGTKLLSNTNECHLFDAELYDCSISGRGGVTEIVRVDAGTIVQGLALSSVDTLDSLAADTTTETLTLEGVLFSGVTDYINIQQNKTWDMIDPIWDVTTYTDFVWVGTTTGNVVNDRRSVKTTIQTPDGTKLSGARVFVYEGLINDNLELKLTTDASGYAEGSFIYKAHATNSSTTTFGTHAIRIYDYGYTPFVAAQTSTESFSGAVTLVTDSAIAEATQATAITNGAGILPVRHGTGETDTRPMKVLNYDAGTGGLPVVGEIMTSGTSTGTVVEYLGNAVTGTLVLELWNGTEFTDNTAITGGTGTFSATTDTASFYQEYTWEIDCSSKSLQITYDYMAARMADTTLLAIFEQIHEWGKSNQGQAIYSGGTGYYTERSGLEGVWLSNRGAGTLAYMTSDANVQFSQVVAPILVQGVTEGAAVKIVANETVGTVTTGDVILETLADVNGEASASINYEAAFDPSGLDVITRVRSSGLPIAAIQDDNGVFVDETTAANSAVLDDMNLLPAVPVATEDRYLFGHPEKFGKVKLDINTAGTGGFTIVWEYWNGTTWAALSNVVDDTSSFSVVGLNYIVFDIPGDWATTTINSQGPYYYIRAAYTAGTVTVVPTGTRCSLDVTKYLPFVQGGTVLSTGLTVTASWVKDVIAKFKPI